jgi:nitrite reductase (NADH) large subunit
MTNLLRLTPQPVRKRLAIVGNGPAAGRLLDALAMRGALTSLDIAVFGEEPVGCYNRVLLSRVLSGTNPQEITLKDAEWYRQANIRFHAGIRVLRLDLNERFVYGTRRITESFDHLVLATGSRAVIPTIPGLHDDDSMLQGAYVFRTLDDCEAIRNSVVPNDNAVVLGGGLLGLEAAKGLADLGMGVTVVDRAPGPMSRQLDLEGQAALSRQLERIGIHCRGGVTTECVMGTHTVEGVRLTNGEVLPCRLLVMACGIHPRIELARSAGLPVKKAMVVNSWLHVEGMPHIHGIGECVEIDGELFGTVAPIWDQVEVLADVLAGRPRSHGYRRAATYTKLKVAGVDVASFGEIGEDHDDEVVIVSQPRENIHAKLRISGGYLVAAQLVGDTRHAARLLQYRDQRIPVPKHRLDLLVSDDANALDSAQSPEICSCHQVSEETVLGAIANGANDLTAIGQATRAGTGCGSCQTALCKLIRKHPCVEQDSAA